MQGWGVAFGAILLMAGTSLAEAQARKAAPTPKPQKVQVTAVAGQEIFLRRGISLERDCTPIPGARIAVVKPPSNGQVVERQTEAFPNYDRDNPRYSCNAKKVPGIAAYYIAKEGFSGVDRFTFAIVHYDGDAYFYDVEVTVWR